MKVKFARKQNGSAVIIVLVLLAVMLALVIAGTQSLSDLKAELKEVERDQTNRLARTPAGARSP
jgi:type II secretory pathway component PulK